MLIDTHAHLHFPDYPDPEGALKRARAAGVEKVFCIGTTAADSQLAINFATKHNECVGTAGLHPHDAKHLGRSLDELGKLVTSSKVVGVGECGLDYYYLNSPRPAQEKAFRAQIELALEYNKPLIFHVRQAFKDFFKIIDSYDGVEGVVHSFSSRMEDLDNALSRGLYVALNGIMTFTKNDWQLAAAKAVPTDKLLLETDAPFLTPAPQRGKVNEPANVRIVAEFLANLRGESLEKLMETTSKNAKELFKL